MDSDRIYFDHNATSLLDIDVKKILLQEYANPSSLHKEGRQARNIVESARDDLLEAINAQDHEIIFTSSCTEANNTIFNSFSDHIHIVSSIEHPSIINASSSPILIPVTKNGDVDLNKFESILQETQQKFLVSVMTANNETGVIQPIKEISQLVHKYDGIIHTDAAQAFGKITTDITELDVDLMTISGHKCGAITGVGALIFRRDLSLNPLLKGGGQEKKLRAGTENVLAISSLQCITNKLSELITRMQEIMILRNKLETQILDISQDAIIFGKEVDRLPNTSFISMPNNSADLQLIHFDLNGIALGKGSACSAGTVKESSHVLEAMQTDKDKIKNALRVSLGYYTKATEVDKFVKLWGLL